MRAPRIVSLAAASMALCFGLGTFRSLQADTRPQDADREKEESAKSVPDEALDAAIEKRIQGKAPLDDVKIEAQWRRKTGMISARVYGSGVGIWRDATQFQLSREQVLDLLRAFERAHFADMPKQFGSDEESEGESEEEREKEKEREKPKEKTFFQFIINLRVGTEQRRVAQSMTGDQSEALRKLTQKIIAVCEKAARTGVSATSMGDGLSKLASGKLAPEALQLLVRRKTDRPTGPGAEDGNWTLRLDGRRVVDATVSADKTATRRVLVLSQDDFRKLAALLAENDPTGMPRNLYSPQYLTLDLHVLKARCDVSARRYTGTTAETHGAKQAAFDRIYATVLALHARAEKEGTILRGNAE
jgi:hypothetical protein